MEHLKEAFQANMQLLICSAATKYELNFSTCYKAKKNTMHTVDSTTTNKPYDQSTVIKTAAFN